MKVFPYIYYYVVVLLFNRVRVHIHCGGIIETLCGGDTDPKRWWGYIRIVLYDWAYCNDNHMATRNPDGNKNPNGKGWWGLIHFTIDNSN